MPKATHQTTWVDTAGVTWRVERFSDRWTLSRYEPLLGGWSRAGSYPSRAAAIEASYTPEGGDR
jgi:hypothetical protein